MGCPEEKAFLGDDMEITVMGSFNSQTIPDTKDPVVLRATNEGVQVIDTAISSRLARIIIKWLDEKREAGSTDLSEVDSCPVGDSLVFRFRRVAGYVSGWLESQDGGNPKRAKFDILAMPVAGIPELLKHI